MASTIPQEKDTGRLHLETGDLIDDFDRRAQEKSGNRGVTANLTAFGARMHGIEQSTRLSVLVFEEGIWITPKDD